MGLLNWLRLPATRGVADLDDPATTLLHRRIIQEKPWLRRLYVDFYRQFSQAMPHPEGKVLVELGSGGGFLKEILPSVITSDVLDLPNVDRVFAAEHMPFDDASVDGIFMFDVLHHMADPAAFLAEAGRCLKVGGRVVCIEPANTAWARFVYTRFHHEGFDPRGPWSTGAGPLSQANGALPWIIFVRDRQIFERRFPLLRVVRLRNHTPLRYLLSGGLSFRTLAPAFAYQPVRVLEGLASGLNDWIGMFQTVELERVTGPSSHERPDAQL